MLALLDLSISVCACKNSHISNAVSVDLFFSTHFFYIFVIAHENHLFLVTANGRRMATGVHSRQNVSGGENI